MDGHTATAEPTPPVLDDVEAAEAEAALMRMAEMAAGEIYDGGR